MEDFITTGYNLILFQLKEQKKQTQQALGNFNESNTVPGSGGSAVGGTQMTPPPASSDQGSTYF